MDRIPPQALEIERAVLGTFLADHEAVELAMDKLTTESFYHGGHQKIFQAMSALWVSSKPIDIITVSEALKAEDWFEQIGGAGYLSEIAETLVAAANIEYYVRVMNDKRSLRNLITTSKEIFDSCFNPDSEAKEVIDAAEKKIYGIATMGSADTVFDSRRMVTDTYGEMERVALGGSIGVTTGYPSVDEKVLGLCPGDLVIIGGRPGSGKTAWALNMILKQTVNYQIPVLMFSIEMHGIGLGQRLFSIESGVSIYNIRQSRSMSKEKYQSIAEASSRISEAPFYYDPSGSCTVDKIRSVSRRMLRTAGIQAIYVDHTRLMKHGHKNPIDGMSDIAHGLKQIAKELNVPVIALHQIARPEKGKTVRRPRLDDLRGSGAVEEDADLVMFVHREFYYTKKEEDRYNAEIIMEKQRNGGTGTINMRWDADHTKFSETEQQEAW